MADSMGADLIAQERQRQIEVEGWTPEHDDEHTNTELTSAAIAYAHAARSVLAARKWAELDGKAFAASRGIDVEDVVAEARDDPLGYQFGRDADGHVKPPSLGGVQWPWDAEWWKPSADPIRNLVKAGALIAAEIDRLSW